MTKLFLNQIRPTFISLLVLTVLFGGLYPLASTLLVRGVFPSQSDGSLMVGKDRKPLGSASIGQNFTDPKYFWGRLSATAPFAYNAAASTGSNLGSNNPALIDQAKARIDALKATDPQNTKPIPIDLITASGSGLDPDISPEAAEYQAARVARARGLSDSQIHAAIARATLGRQLWVLGEPRVNVLKLNLILDGKL